MIPILRMRKLSVREAKYLRLSHRARSWAQVCPTAKPGMLTTVLSGRRKGTQRGAPSSEVSVINSTTTAITTTTIEGLLSLLPNQITPLYPRSQTGGPLTGICPEASEFGAVFKIT